MSQEFDWKEIRIPEQKEFDGLVFPLVLSPKDELKDKPLSHWVEEVKKHRAWLEKKSLDHGSVLFRGFPLSAAADFDTFPTALGYTPMPYIGGAAPRRNLVGGVFTTNESPPDKFINFHHEMAQNPKFPRYIWFFCEKPSASGGGTTPIILSHIVHRKMKEKFPDVVEKLEKVGVRYTRYLGNGDDHTSTIGRGWQSTWLTDDKKVAEERCASLGGQCEWQPNGSMRIQSAVLSAMRVDPRDGKTRWFNQLGVAHPEHGWKDTLNSPSHACMYADGTPLPQEALRWMLDMMNENCVDFPWQKGDTLYNDNLVVLHGRRTWVPGTERSILAWLAQ